MGVNCIRGGVLYFSSTRKSQGDRSCFHSVAGEIKRGVEETTHPVSDPLIGYFVINGMWVIRPGEVEPAGRRQTSRSCPRLGLIMVAQ